MLAILMSFSLIGTTAASAGTGQASTVASASNPACKNKTTRKDPANKARVNVYYCSISKPAYVFSSDSHECGVNYCWGGIDKLNKAGYANWFVCQYTSAYDGVNWARTEGDGGKWGWVSAWYYSGTSSKWPLPSCETADPGALHNDDPY